MVTETVVLEGIGPTTPDHKTRRPLLPTYGSDYLSSDPNVWKHPSYGVDDIGVLYGQFGKNKDDIKSLSEERVHRLVELRLRTYGIENALFISETINFPPHFTRPLEEEYPDASTLLTQSSASQGIDALLEDLFSSRSYDEKRVLYQAVNDIAFISSARATPLESEQRISKDRVHALAAVQAAILLVGRQDTGESTTV